MTKVNFKLIVKELKEKKQKLFFNLTQICHMRSVVLISLSLSSGNRLPNFGQISSNISLYSPLIILFAADFVERVLFTDFVM